VHAWEMYVAAAVLAILFGVLFAFGVKTALAGRKISDRVASEGGTLLLGAWPMEAFHWMMRGVGRLIVATRLTPDALTLTSLVLTLACIPLLALGHFAVGAFVFLLGSMFDAFDGIVARARKMSSDSGEVLDAVVDRYADAAPLIGLAMFYRYSLWQMALPLVALIGSMMVSYTRAKAEAMQVKLPPGLMRRHERIAYLGLGLIFGPLLQPILSGEVERIVPGVSIVYVATLAAVAFVAVMSNVAAVLLIRQLRARLVASGRGPGPEDFGGKQQ
jgi:CDP-diacylglycerol---glycerol-3-phosphate 3-phosphatidyltransferase